MFARAVVQGDVISHEHANGYREEERLQESWAKYIWIYLAVGGIAYLLIYLFAFHHVGGAAGGGGY